MEAGIIACLELSGDPNGDLASVAAIHAERRVRRPEFASPIRWLPASQINEKKPTPC
jgi:hypothetical protein